MIFARIVLSNRFNVIFLGLFHSAKLLLAAAGAAGVN